jgi:hypothetical protein
MEKRMSDGEAAAAPVPVFEPWPKIPRLNRHLVITEKIDGTNASIKVLEDGRVLAGSRTRWVTPQSDNFGWAAWVAAHEDELRTGLGVGHHFGEWWGVGIQRGYGLYERRFSLFNTHRWNGKVPASTPPACCLVVPVLYSGPNTPGVVDTVVQALREKGSSASPGFTPPEGVVVFHAASKQMFKVTCSNDEEPKGKVNHD